MTQNNELCQVRRDDLRIIVSPYDYTVGEVVSAKNKLQQTLANPVQGWQPIETAPKDGTEVILWNIEWENVYSGSYGNFYIWSDDEKVKEQLDFTPYKESDFIDEDSTEDDIASYNRFHKEDVENGEGTYEGWGYEGEPACFYNPQPTHWRPMPQPPQGDL